MFGAGESDAVARVLARARAAGRVFGAGGSGAVGRVFRRVCWRWSGCLARAEAVLWDACFGACAGGGAGVWRGRERCCGARVLARAWAVEHMGYRAQDARGASAWTSSTALKMRNEDDANGRLERR